MIFISDVGAGGSGGEIEHPKCCFVKNLGKIATN